MLHLSAGGQRSVFVNVIILLKTSRCDQTGCSMWRSVSSDRHVMITAEPEIDTNTTQSVRLRSPVSYSSPRLVVQSWQRKNRSTVLTPFYLLKMGNGAKTCNTCSSGGMQYSHSQNSEASSSNSSSSVSLVCSEALCGSSSSIFTSSEATL